MVVIYVFYGFALTKLSDNIKEREGINSLVLRHEQQQLGIKKRSYVNFVGGRRILSPEDFTFKRDELEV